MNQDDTFASPTDQERVLVTELAETVLGHRLVAFPERRGPWRPEQLIKTSNGDT